LQGTAANLEEAIQEREELSETCADLKQQMAQVHVQNDVSLIYVLFWYSVHTTKFAGRH